MLQKFFYVQTFFEELYRLYVRAQVQSVLRSHVELKYKPSGWLSTFGNKVIWAWKQY